MLHESRVTQVIFDVRIIKAHYYFVYGICLIHQSMMLLLKIEHVRSDISHNAKSALSTLEYTK